MYVKHIEKRNLKHNYNTTNTNNKPRPSAGLFLIDSDYNVCLIMRKFPYNDPLLGVKITRKIDNTVVVSTFKTFLEMIQIPRGAQETNDETMMNTALREFREETKCKSRNINMYQNFVDLSWMDDGDLWEYRIYIGKIFRAFEFNKKFHEFRPCVINISKSNNKYACKIDANSLDKHHEILVIMNINEYYRFMINEQLTNYESKGAGYYKKCLDTIMALSYRKPTGTIME